MSAQQAVYAALAAAGPLTALIGQRLYPDEAPEDTELPLVIHQATLLQPETDLAGQVLARAVTLSVTCWAKERIAANALADACCTALLAAGIQWSQRDDSIFDVTTGAYASVIGVQAWD